MSVPPPPNQWGSPPPTGGQPVAGQQWGAAPGGQPGGVPKWGPQQPWGPPPGTPPGRGGKGKWILAGIAVLAVIAVTVVITVLVVGKDSGSSPNQTPTNGNGSDFASANDKGPVGIISEEPTCAAWNRIADEFVAIETKSQWRRRDSSIPATAWTPDQRSMYESVGKAMDNAADQTVNLVKTTPHRVVRELYEQFIAYARLFNNSVPQYEPDNNYLAGVVDGTGSALVDICAAITSQSAAAISPLVSTASSPTTVSAPSDSANPQRFVTVTNPACNDWVSTYDRFDADTATWRAMDPNIPATQWTADQKATVDTAAPIMTAFADKAEEIGRSSDNPILEDIAVLSAQYRRAIVKALPTYTPADNYLSEVSTFLAQAINTACLAVEG
jgi:hypothetical protein